MRTQLLATALGLAATTQAAVVFTDTFTSGTAADAGYYRFGTTNTTLAVGGGDIDFVISPGATARSGVIKSFAEQTLAIGDSITFSFDISARDLASAQNHAFRWSIGNLGNPSAVTGAPVTADLASATPFASGTRVFHSFSASTGATAGYGGIISGQTSPVVNTSISAYTGYTGPVSVATTGATSVSLTITRNSATDYSISQTAFGSNFSGTITGAASGANIFNTIAFSTNNAPGSGTDGFSLDNISVTYTAVPEPSSFAALAGLGALGFVASRRRRGA